MTTTTAERAERSKTGAGPPTPVCFARLVPLLVLLAGCVPDPAALERTPPRESAPDSEGPGLVAGELLHLFGFARAAAAAEVEAVALALPCGCRDGEIAWVLEHAPAIAKARVIASLDRGETARASLMLRECARSADPDERDAALAALTRAGDADVMPLVARALRVELREASLVVLAAAAGTSAPCARLTRSRPRSRGRGRRARASRSRRHSEMRWMPRRSGSWARAARFAPPHWSEPCNSSATRASRRFRVRYPTQLRSGRAPATPRPKRPRRSTWRRLRRSPRTPFGSVSSRAGSRAGSGAEVPERPAPRWRWARSAARDATAALAEALRDADGLLIKTVSASLATALRTSPEREPEDPIEIRRLWFPILATLVRKD